MRTSIFTLARSLGIAGLLALTAVVSSSCGSQEPTAPPASTGGQPESRPSPPAEEAKTDDPCSLLTDREVVKALGSDADPPKRDGDSLVNACSWFPEGGGDGVTNVRVAIVAGGRATYDQNKAVQGGEADKVSGVGDEAFEVSDGTGTKLSTVEGEKVLEVTTPEQSDAEELAKKALARL